MRKNYERDLIYCGLTNSDIGFYRWIYSKYGDAHISERKLCILRRKYENNNKN